jgi:hypothetical protein
MMVLALVVPVQADTFSSDIAVGMYVGNQWIRHYVNLPDVEFTGTGTLSATVEITPYKKSQYDMVIRMYGDTSFTLNIDDSVNSLQKYSEDFLRIKGNPAKRLLFAEVIVVDPHPQLSLTIALIEPTK